MGLLVPDPAPHAVWSAGPNDFGDFVIASRDGMFVLVPEEWRVPVAAWLLSDTKLFAPEVFRRLRELEAKLAKKRKKTPADESEVEFVGKLAHSMECLMYEYLDADPKTSTRYEYRPEYYQDRVRELRKKGVLKEPDPETASAPEEIDDTPLPW